MGREIPSGANPSRRACALSPSRLAATPRVASLDETKRTYRNNLPVAEDTTADAAQALLTPGFLRFVGELLFGERWQTPLARWLGETRGRLLSPATIHRWSTGRRSIPDWVGEALAVILENGQRELDRRGRSAGELAARIRAPRPRQALRPDWAKKARGRRGPDILH